MTDENLRPLCMYVKDLEEGTNTFHGDPNSAVSSSPAVIRCSKHAVLSFSDNGELFHACEHHAPEEYLDELQIPVPRGRNRKNRISV